ncbi:MAG TPA: sulfate ABC transporter substrate-binding protein [Thermoanaerobaculia bacterium]
MLAAMMIARRVAAAVLLLAGLFSFVACRKEETPSGGAGSGKPVTLILGAYTTPREVYGKAILPAFEKAWLAKTGQRVEFRESYQGSGAQARAIIGGFEADVAALSLEGDIDKIVQAGLITHDWKAAPHGGMVSDSIVVLAVRPGNPKKVLDWPDLARAGLNVLTPDPKTSGGAQWNINAMYGAALRGFAGAPKDDRAAAKDFLKRVFRNVSIMDKGARESITTFEKGVGDVAITYENEVLIGRQAGQSYDYAVPRSTILIENPVALVDKSVDKHGVRPVAEAFVTFLHEPEAQRLFARYGLRSVDEAVAKESASKLPAVQDLWKIDYLGGWKKVAEELYGPAGVFTQVYSELGSKR